MSDVVLSQGVRQNLLSLQNTASLLSRTQERLSTGKKVNSALDNPINFFTSSSLQSRANDLGRLLDSVSNAVQTVQAADKGISAITKLIESAQATARQALSSAQPAATYALSVEGDAAITADTPAAATSGETLATASANASNVATYELDLSDLSGLTDEDELTITFGATSVTLEFDDDASIAGSGEGFTDVTSAVAALEAVFGAGNVSEDSGVITIKGTDYATDFSQSGDASLTGLGDASNTAELGDTLTVTVGSTTTTFYYVADIEDAAEGTFAYTDIDDIGDAFTAADIGVTAAEDPDNAGGLVMSAASGSFTVGGTVGTALDFGATTFDPSNADIGALTGTLTIAVTGQSNQTITFGAGNVTTRAGLLAELNGLDGITATINSDNQVEFTSTANVSLTITGDNAVLTELGLDEVAGEAQAATATVADESATRTTAQTAYNELLTQITQLAQDSSFNGINLLNSDNLTVTFNEDGSSSLTISGVDFTATGLGLTAQTGQAFQSNAGVNAAIAELDSATATLRAQASAFGSNLSIIQARQDFTKNMINVLQIGADNLVLADSNEEGANMLALNTRQQLSTVALSLAAQADQNVLRLF